MRERLLNADPVLQKLVDQGVEEFIASYAVSTRRLEIAGDADARVMIGVTRSTVGQWEETRRADFYRALEEARSLVPGNPDIKELRF